MRLMVACIGEFVGTYILVCIGTMSVAVAVLTDIGLSGWTVAAVWGVALAISVYFTSPMSGAHLNPAVTLALALFRKAGFPRARLPFYWAAQFTGAVMAGLTVLVLFGARLRSFEAANGIVRGDLGSERSGMVFGEYFPNPAALDLAAGPQFLVTPIGAALVEGFGTAVLAFVVFTVVDRRAVLPWPRFTASVALGLTLMVLIGLFAPLTQGGWNPARDFGPRLVAYAAGWGEIAIPGPSAGFWAYIIGPFVGAPAGALAYALVSRLRTLSRI